MPEPSRKAPSPPPRKRSPRRPERTLQLSTIGVLSAISFVLMFLEIQTPFSEFLKYDPSDCAALVGGFTLGPKAGVGIVLVRNLLRGMLVKPDPVGLMMNAIAGSTLVFFAAGFYVRRLSKKAAAQGLFLGGVLQALVCLPTSWVALGLYGFPPEARTPFVLHAILPFNLLKASLNGVLTFWLYKKIARHLPRSRTLAPVPEAPQGSEGTK